MINKICFCTLRDNKGATGGPAGVLFLQKEVLGESISGVKCEYWFNTFRDNGKIVKLMNMLAFACKSLFSRQAYFFTHDITSAWILALLGKRYTLVYHSQGPILEETKNLGKHLGSLSTRFLAKRERVAFTHANTLHFPSMGAADMYFDSQYATCKREKVNLKKPLYNIIPQVNPVKPDGFPLDKDSHCLTFFSLGTLTIAKGQDQTIEFIAELLKYYHSPVRYILVGKGPLKEQLLKRLDEIKASNAHFAYVYFDAVPHDAVMYLHQIADIYIMLHRISIFDFATLEAMSQGSTIVLSKVGGNPEFNYDGNVVFAEEAMANMKEFVDSDFNILKQKNKAVFAEHFSSDAFREQYEAFVSNIM